MGFEPVTSVIPVRWSTNWAVKPHIGSKLYLPVVVDESEGDNRTKFCSIVSFKANGYFITEPHLVTNFCT